MTAEDRASRFAWDDEGAAQLVILHKATPTPNYQVKQDGTTWVVLTKDGDLVEEFTGRDAESDARDYARVMQESDDA